MHGNQATEELNKKVDLNKDLIDSLGSISARVEKRLAAAGPHDADSYVDAAWHIGQALTALKELS